MIISQKDLNRFWTKVIKTDNCWNWTATKSRLRGCFRFSGRIWMTHRFAMIHIYKVPNPNNKPEVCHTCDNPSCIRQEHLFWGTHQENMDDMVRKGRTNPRYGSDNNMTKLTEQQRLEIRSKYKPPNPRYAKNGYSTWKLAKEYNVSQAAIHQLLKT